MNDPKTQLSLDAFDMAILGILQRDNRTAQRLIAEQVHLSAPAVQRRIKRLEEAGVIASQVAVLSPGLLGKPLLLVVEVQFVSEKLAKLATFDRRLLKEAAVQQCYSVTGEADYLLFIVVGTMEEYVALTKRLFESDDNVRHFKTSVVLRKIKSSLQVPLS